MRRILANESLGTDLLLSQTSTGDQRSPAVAMEADGDWIAIWTTDHLADEVDRPFGRGTSSGGTILGAEFAFATGASIDAASPAVDFVGSDYLVGAWRNDTGSLPVEANFRSKGGTNFGLSTIDASASGTRVAVAGLGFPSSSGDEWVAAWHSADASANGVYYRCLDQEETTDVERLAHGLTGGDQVWADVARLSPWRFVVVWQDGTAVKARLFDRLDTEICSADGGEIEVSATGEAALFPRVAAGPDGAFVVAWYEDTLDEDNGIAAREFTKDGVPVGARFAVHPELAGAQSDHDLAVSATSFAVVWTDPDGDGPDRDVHARLFRRRVIFTDGFETGDLVPWSDDKPL